MSPLLVRPRQDAADGVVHRVTPASAGWRYVGFEAIDLAPGARFDREEGDRELCLVLVTGSARVRAGEQDFGLIGGRRTPFEGSPYSVYLPPGIPVSVQAEGPVELAICASPAKGRFPARLIPPDAVGELVRGSGTNLRHVRNILPDTAEAETLLVVEVVTPGGHWSSYPPHKHDTDDAPNETYLEETYYHRLKRGSGFALQRVYTKDGSLDETMAVSDRDVVLVPKGYHPVGAPHGFDLYYLNVMAGPVRQWKFTMDPDQAHLPY
ncbi:5-deoxy-glucuronate isomerase [Acetobacteraceae bacterium KSS8]|uniref:5-deoxy-glucuronate isomerase n=1 Tax=Endosaccharibacter trunci TaxID=2812733 RepID=A0ABT1W8B6_9PROT|nr:5-deoxy-glucuronate isomerase [Acetobacteraceae bacterium KSS8]